ncbi:hypothetical protein SBA4_3100009 [Candidatus Sulfopaludibacter sp. SbA4]|nr:hypothetical protein SBA4_3100009 [Candidatus Sulfopaludibacter sp. SbA4]
MQKQPIELVRQLNGAAPPGFGLGLPHPPVDGIMAALIEAFRSADVNQRRAATEALTVDAELLLLSYAWESAAEAVRRSAPSILADGLAALSIENGRYDARDSIVQMAVLFRSAEKLGLNTVSLFTEAADLALDAEFKRVMVGFPSRLPENRDLGKAFFIGEKMTKDGFEYERQPGVMERAISRKIWWGRVRKLLGKAP